MLSFHCHHADLVNSVKKTSSKAQDNEEIFDLRTDDRHEKLLIDINDFFPL